MKQEELFAKNLAQLKETARENGNFVTTQEVQEAFAQLELSGEQLQLVYDYLLKSKIGIDRPLDPEECLTEEEKNYLDNYLEELKELTVYTDDQKLAFAQGVMAGDEAMQGLLIQSYLEDVVQIARLYLGQGVLLEDLIGEGNLALTMGAGMLGCLEDPKEAKGMLARMVMDAMEELICERAELDKEAQKVLKKINKVSQKAVEMAKDLERKVTVEELSKESGMSEKYIREAMELSGNRIGEIES